MNKHLAVLMLALTPLSSAVEVNAQDAEVPATTSPPIDLEAVLRGSGEGWTAERVAERARQTAPGLDRGRALLQQARAGASQAYLGFFPRLELTARYTRLSPITQGGLGSSFTPEQIAGLQALIGQVADPAARSLFDINLQSQVALANFRFPVLLDQFSFGAQLTVPISDVFFQVLPAYEGAERAVEAQRAQLEAQASEVSQVAREAFYNYARARAAATVAAATVETIEAQERVLAAAVEAGAVPRVELMRLRAQLAGARVATERARGGAAVAAEALRALMHLDQADEILVAEDLLAPIAPVTESRERLIETARTSRPELRALERLRRARARMTEAAEGSRYPHLVLNGQLSFDNPNNRVFPAREQFIENWSISAVVSWAPNDFFAGEASVEQARAAQAQTDADTRQLEDAIRIQVTQALEQFRAAQLALEAARAGIEAAEESVRVRTEQLRAGAGLVTELMLATSDRARAQLDLVTAAIDARIAHTQLQRALGLDGPYELGDAP